MKSKPIQPIFGVKLEAQYSLRSCSAPFPGEKLKCEFPCNMASDEIVWQIINQQFCAFKLKYVTDLSPLLCLP